MIDIKKSEVEIEIVLKYLLEEDSTLTREMITLMYCVGSYPARNTDLRRIALMHEMFGVSVGYSCHSYDIHEIPYRAVEEGATVIEKHLNCVNHIGPDTPHSVTPDEFKVMVNRIRGKSHVQIMPTSEENDMITKYKRRIKCIKPIVRGQKLILENNFGIFRSVEDDIAGFTPLLVREFEGAVARRDLKVGEGISLIDKE